MKIDSRFRLAFFIILAALTSCGLFKYPRNTVPDYYGEKTEIGYLKINLDSFKHKGQLQRQLSAIVRDSSGKMITQYSIQDICGCFSKNNMVPTATHYKLTTEFSFDIPISDGDKFIFKKFSNHPRINEFCSRTLLDSAKGFVKLPRKQKKSGTQD